jgi:hypothetical protein
MDTQSTQPRNNARTLKRWQYALVFVASFIGGVASCFLAAGTLILVFLAVLN